MALPLAAFVRRGPLVALLITAASALRAQTPAGAVPADTRAERVELLQNASVQESLSRSTNIDFGSVRVDGQRSGASLSALTSDQVLSVEATKVPTPDLDADAVGGLLRVTTRRSYDQSSRTLRGEVSLGYDQLVRRFLPDVSVTYGNAFGRDRRFGFLGTFQYADEAGIEEAVELDWDRTGNELQEVEMDWGRDRSREFNFNGTLDWKLGQAGFAFLRADGSLGQGSDESYETSFQLEDAPADAPPDGVVLTDVTSRRGIRGGRARDLEATLAAGLSLKRAEWAGELNASHTRSDGRESDGRSYEFEQEDLSFRYHRLGAFPRFTVPSGTSEVPAASYALNELEVGSERREEADSMVSFDLTRQKLFSSRPGWLKFGGKVRSLRTDNREQHDLYVEGPAGMRLGNAAATAPVRATLDGRYLFSGFPTVGSLNRIFDTEPGRFLLDADRTRGETDPANYDVTQKVFAAYGVASAGFGRTRLLAGLRVERTDNSFNANEVVFGDDGAYEATLPSRARTNYTNWFPGLHATFAASPALTVFGSWSQSIIRPDYTELVPSREIQRSSLEIDEGNPNLKATLYTNYDAAVDFEYSDGGKLALQAFHRRISDATVQRSVVLTAGPFAGYERSRPENAGGATLSGFDLTWEQELGGLSDVLEDAALELTYTYKVSRQQIEGRPGVLPLAGEPRHALEAAVSWEAGDFEIDLQAEYQGRSLQSAGRSPSEDRFRKPGANWEISITRNIGERQSVYLEVENLTRQAEAEYQGTPSRPTGYELPQREYRLGYRWEM